MLTPHVAARASALASLGCQARRGLALAVLFGSLAIMACIIQPGTAWAQATTFGRPFSGDAGSEFRYQDFVVGEDRTLRGELINEAARPRRDVEVVITAIGLQSRAPVWSTKKRFSQISPGDRVSIQDSYGRFTAAPGAFTFEFTESDTPPPPPEPEVAAPGTGSNETIGEIKPTKNACSNIRNVRGRFILEGEGVCNTVSIPLRPGEVDVKITRKGRDPIVVTLIDEDSEAETGLANEADYYNTRATTTIAAKSWYKMKVDHQGEWEITLSGRGLGTLNDNSNSQGASTRRQSDDDEGRIRIILE